MSTIVTRRVNGSGPYAYRVTYEPASDGDDEHEWEYLGRAGAIDPEILTDDEIAELRAEGIGLARYRDHEVIDVRRLEEANRVRDELPDDALAVADDRRTAEITLTEDAPQAAVELAEAAAEDMVRELEGAGQADLTDAERQRIDFAETDIPTARAAKAAILDEGVDDWTAVWSEDLKTTQEAREAARNNRESIVGDRLDNDEGVSQTTTSAAQTRSEQERQALKYAKQGDDSAREYLLEDAGWTADEIANTPAPA
ncbi:hypothetical protein [Halorubrum ezzemoulense]|nr:hypothetical protein [Halorubrum ezzemoulense]